MESSYSRECWWACHGCPIGRWWRWWRWWWGKFTQYRARPLQERIMYDRYYCTRVLCSAIWPWTHLWEVLVYVAYWPHTFELSRSSQWRANQSTCVNRSTSSITLNHFPKHKASVWNVLFLSFYVFALLTGHNERKEGSHCPTWSITCSGTGVS